MTTKIYLIRHTQTIGNVEKRLTGRCDYEVTQTGNTYIDKLTEKLESIKFDVAYASTSKRTSKTISKLAKLNNLKIVELEELCEMYFGIYDGKTWEEVNQIDPNIDKLHQDTNEIMCIPEQETTKEVEQRMYAVMSNIAKQNSGKNVLVCSHGVAIEAFLRRITGEAFSLKREEYSQKNTSLNIVEYDSEKDEFKVTLLNDLSHLNKKENSLEER